MKASERHLQITDEQSYACWLISDFLIETIIILVLFHSLIYIILFLSPDFKDCKINGF